MSENDPYYKSRPKKYEAHKEAMRIKSAKNRAEIKLKLERLEELELKEAEFKSV